MIKLKLVEGLADIEQVKKLPGLQGVKIDEEYGLINIQPKENLYIIRAENFDNLRKRQKLSPEIVGIFGDMRIGPI